MRRWAFWRWPSLGAALGGALGLVFVVISVIAGGGTWAAMLLLASVASFPAGLWIISLAASMMEHGSGDLVFAAIILGPAINFAVIFGLLGALITFLERSRAS